MAELGVGYISIVPEVSKITPGISKALQGVDPVAEKSGKSMGSKISSGISTTLKASVAGVGVAAGGTLAASLTKGLGRLTGIENAQASLRGLGHDADSVSAIMDNALASVKGTAFGLEDAAGVAASTVAAGVEPGKELERTLTMVGDAATIAGIDISSMGSIVNKVATSDMMQMDVANQLMDAGIPILQMVAEEMGVTADEARKMASDGEVSFEIFQTALEKGVGGAALEAGNTFEGAVANVGAALGRLGATSLEPFFDLSKDAMGSATDAIDALEGRIGPMADNVSRWLTGTAVPAVKDFVGSLQDIGQMPQVQTALSATKSAFDAVVSAGKALAPVAVDIGSAFAKASAGLGLSAWTSLSSILGSTAGVLEALSGPLETVSSFLEDHPGLVAAGITAWGAYKTVPGIVKRLTDTLAPARQGIKSFGETVGDVRTYAEATGREMGRFEAITWAAGTSSNKTIAAMGRELTNAANSTGAFSKATGVVKAGFEGVKGAASGLVGFLGGPWGIAITGATAALGVITNANSTAESAHDAMAESVREGAVAQAELQAAVRNTSGALNEQALEAASKVAKAELSEIIDLGGQYQDMVNVITAPDLSFWQQGSWSAEWREYNDHISQLQDEYAALESAAEHFGIKIEDINGIVAEGGDDYRTLIEHLRGMGDEGNDAADSLEGARAEIDQLINDARRLEPAIAEAAAAIGILADSSSSADEQLGALQRMLQAMGLAPKDAEMAMRDAAEAVDELVESATNTEVPLEHMGQGLLDAAEASDWTHEGWRNLSGTLQGMAEELQNVAVNNGDVDATFAMQQEALDALAGQYDISREEVDKLARQMGLVPEEVKTAVALSGADEASQDLAKVWAAYESTTADRTIEVSAITGDAKADLEDIGFVIKDIPGSENVTITATDDQAKATLDAVMTQLGDLSDMEVAPAVLLNTDELEGSSEHAFGILEALNIENPTPQADIIISQLLQGVDISQGQLDYLAGLSPTPTADLNKWLLEAGVSVSNDMLDALAGRHPTSTLDADGKPLHDGVDGANRKLNELQDKKVTLTFEERRITYWESRGHSPEQAAKIQGPVPYGQTGGRFSGAGFNLPRYEQGARHDGYRLPTSGPGTDVVDGFLAYDALGMPAARLDTGEWVINGQSSEQYNNELAAINAGTFPKLPGYADGDRHGADSGEARRAISEGGVSEPADVIDYADILGDAFEQIPEDVTTTVTLTAAGVTDELGMIGEQLTPLGEGETIPVEASADQAMAALGQVGDQAAALPDSENVEVTASGDQATATLEGVGGQLDELGAMEVLPAADLDISDLEGSTGVAHSELDSLAAQTPTPDAHLTIDALLSNKNAAQGELDVLAAQTPTPRSDMDNNLLNQGVAHAEGELQRVGNSKATSVVDAHNQAALTNINATIDALDRMPVERVIRIVASGSAASALAGGGRVPGFASGGRLPTSGPGTDTVDGILGVDGQGMPTARVDAGEWVINRRMSDNYDRELAAINAGVFPKLPGYADGGKVGSVSPEQLLDFAGGLQVNGQQAARSLERAAYVWGGVNWGDCSGAMAGLARFATGMSAFGGRFATGNQREALSGMGFSPGLGPAGTSFNLGWFNGGPWGGHTAGTIAGVNVEMGGGRGDGQIGGGAAGAAHPQFTDHAHIPLGELWAFDYFRPIARSNATYQPAPSPSYVTEGGNGVGTGGMGVQIAAGLGGGVQSTSTEGVHLNNGDTIPWSRSGLYDEGGVWDPGTIGVNLTGAREAVLNPRQWDIFDRAVGEMPAAVAALNNAAAAIGNAAGGIFRNPQGSVEEIRREVVDVTNYLGSTLGSASVELERAALGLNTSGDAIAELVGRGYADQIMAAIDVSDFGGEWVRQAELVQEAEANLVDVRSTISDEVAAIGEAETALVEAQQRLSEARSADVALSTSTQRKIEDDEKRLAEAREDGDPGKIADAEQKLARTREDAAGEMVDSAEDNVQEIADAAEAVESAEAKLTDARYANADAAERLEAAEREIVAARFQSVADMATGIGEAAASSMGHLSSYFDEMSRLAGIVENTRQEVSQLQMQQITNQVNLLKAQHDLQTAEWDVHRTRARGALNLVEAEQRVEDARAQAALMGATGIEAMSGAMDRFRETGVFSVGEVSESVIENSAEVQAALWGVQAVEAQNALDALNAAHAQTMAQHALTTATLTHMQATEILQLQTQHLTAQTAQMYGLTSNQATGAARGFGGLGGLLGGLGKVIGGALTGVAGFATAGPLGAIPGAIMAITGLGEGIKGGIDLFNNRDDVSDAWSEMGALEKLGIVGGGLLGGAATVGGAYLGGPEGAVAGAELGDALIGTTIGSFQYSISSQIEKLNRDHADRLAELQLGFAQREASLEEDRLIEELEYLRERERLEADVAYAELMQQIAQSTSEDMTNALLDAAAVEAARAGRADDEQLGELRRSGDALDQLVDLMRQQVDATRATAGNRPESATQIATALSRVLVDALGRSGVDADQYVDSTLN